MVDLAISLAQLDELADELARRGDTELAKKARATAADLRAAISTPSQPARTSCPDRCRKYARHVSSPCDALARDTLLEGFNVGGSSQPHRYCAVAQRDSQRWHSDLRTRPIDVLADGPLPDRYASIWSPGLFVGRPEPAVTSTTSLAHLRRTHHRSRLCSARRAGAVRRTNASGSNPRDHPGVRSCALDLAAESLWSDHGSVDARGVRYCWTQIPAYDGRVSRPRESSARRRWTSSPRDADDRPILTRPGEQAHSS